MNSTEDINYTVRNFSITNKSPVIVINITLQYVRIGSLIICICLSLICNFSFIAAFSRSRYLYRRSVFCLTLNIVVLCIIISVFNQLLTLILTIKEEWTEYPQFLCISQSFSANVINTCIPLTLLLLSIDRVISIRANLNENAKLAKGLHPPLVALSLLILWLISICLSVPLVTNTIPSVYNVSIYSCVADLRHNMMYTIPFAIITVCFPLLCSISLHIYILDAWLNEKRRIISNGLPKTVKLQIRKEVINSVFTFSLILAWSFFSLPHLVSLCFIDILSSTILTVLYWIHCYFTILPFLVTLIFFKSFRNSLSKLCKTTNERAIANTQTIGDSSQQNTSSTNVVNNDRNKHSSSHSSMSSSFSSFTVHNDAYQTTPSLSYSSSNHQSVSNNVLPKVPVLFATECGVHIGYNTNQGTNKQSINYFESITKDEIKNRSSLCDVNEANFTDFSESGSISTRSSFKTPVRRTSKKQKDFELPSDITTFYNPDDLRVKRSRSRPQNSSIKSIRKRFEKTFETPNNNNRELDGKNRPTSSSIFPPLNHHNHSANIAYDSDKTITEIPRPKLRSHPKKKPRQNSVMRDQDLPKLNKISNYTWLEDSSTNAIPSCSTINDLNTLSTTVQDSVIEMDYIGSTNA